MLLPLIFAIISPFAWGSMNIVDKYVVSQRVKNALSYAWITAFVNVMIGGVFAVFLDWSSVRISDMLFPVLAGILLGSQFFPYYLLLQKEDVSHLIGFIYFYPVIVSLLSFLFLHEVLSLLSYVGMVVTLIGVVLLSVRIGKLQLKMTAWLIALMILVVAVYEFFIKVAVSDIPFWNGTAVSVIFMGLTVMVLAVYGPVRRGIPTEWHNLKWAVLSESLTFVGILTVYFAMSGLPATIVSSLAATQPLAVLLLENILTRSGIPIARDTALFKKLIPIIVIVLGVLLLYLPELL